MRALRAFIVTAMAACGLLAAHWLDYVLVVPDPQHRHDLLFMTGHGYLPRAMAIAAAAGLVAALASTAIGLTGRSERARGRRLVADIVLLAAVQTGAFVALESLERILSRLTSDHRFAIVIAIGAGLQLITAACATLITRLLERAGVALRDLLERKTPEQSVVRATGTSVGSAPRGAILQPGRGPRAPPLAAV